MTVPDRLERARTAFARRAWTQAYDDFRAADRKNPLGSVDLERAALAANLLGRYDDSAALLGRAHQEAIRVGDLARSARHAFWLGMVHIDRGEMAVAAGWLGRAARIIDESGLDCVESGYVLIPEGMGQLDAGEPVAALATFERAAAIAARFEDPDLGTLTRLFRGRALIDMAEIPRGVAQLDEAMVAVTAGEVSPIIVGLVYCASIEAFGLIFDLRRAQEWTEALQAWCDTQPDVVPFRGPCLVYRAALKQFHGAWTEAMDEARRAEELLSRPPPEPEVGEALYQQAELRRLRGEFEEADLAYRGASQWGRRPEPGLALLRLAQGRPKAASAAIRRAVDESPDGIARARLLEAQVEIALAVSEGDQAREASEALSRIAGVAGAPLLTAIARRAEGAVLIAEGNPRGALGALRDASAALEKLDAPYERARVRVWIGQALRQLGDADSAELELDGARRAFLDLGAAPDLARMDVLAETSPSRPLGLSAREIEVLRLVAAGATNRAVAADLGISERTVDRHVSNIFTKLDVSSRSAATAYAYEHGLR